MSTTDNNPTTEKKVVKKTTKKKTTKRRKGIMRTKAQEAYRIKRLREAKAAAKQNAKNGKPAFITPPSMQSRPGGTGKLQVLPLTLTQRDQRLLTIARDLITEVLEGV